MALSIRHRDDRPARTAPFDVLAEVERLNRQLGSYVDAWRQLPDLLGKGFAPVADVEETADAYLVEIELPGVKREDIDIEVAGRHVSVRGERKERQRVGILRRRERTVGRFIYEVDLTGSVDEDGVEAHLEEGVLSIRLPKPESQRLRHVEIA